MAQKKGTGVTGESPSAVVLADEHEQAGAMLKPGSEHSRYELNFPAKIEAVGPLCAFINLVSECNGLDERQLQCVEIAAYEACLNIIEHAYGFDGASRIRLRIHMAPEKVRLLFIDTGKGIDPGQIPAPNLRDPQVRRRGRGFGLQIIRKSMDRMQYRKTRNGENLLLLTKRTGENPNRTTDIMSGSEGDVA